MRVNSSITLLEDGSIDSKAWLDLIARQYQGPQLSLIQSATEFCQKHGADLPSAYASNCFAQGLIMASILTELKADHEALIAALLYELLHQNIVSAETIQLEFGQAPLRIIQSAISLPLAQGSQKNAKSKAEQVERYRKMILAMVNDVRVVLVKLAECVCIMRAIKTFTPAKRQLLAFEMMNVYAPLANRLGIGQIKWELEDRAFACLEAEPYQQIKENLREKRVDRERYIDTIKAQLLVSLKQAGVKAEVAGRAKHIYSIWRKMQKKQLSFEKLFDVQALRVLVPDVSACYVALSCVHELWPPIASEFRDYISSPKPNGYRSIHSIVIGPEQKRIEIQIRTFAMHEESEKGVAAHWRYKEGSVRDANLENRINWLRSLLEWQKELGSESQELQALHSKVVDEQIYVFTPEGEVIDLAKGATALDFAYRIHTEVGHRCQGAKVNGKLVPLSSALQTTDKVEIVLGKLPKPSRDWLSRQTPYIVTDQARKKIQQWFRQQLSEKVVEEKLEPEAELDKPEFEISLKKPKPISHDDIIVYGVDNLLTRTAGCCRPIMGDKVMGYITQGRGISVHRADCHVLQNVTAEHADRLIQVKWGENTRSRYPVDLTLYAQNRGDLLKDITHLFSQESLSILSLQSMIDKTDDTLIVYTLIEIHNTEQMQRVLSLLKQLKGVVEVKRGR
ncbi:MAG: HD domain-containing protein [Gammaproteobacteria bacterium]|nr:HD domain-containing protein [Gammaproteobacteria bacterium]